MTPLEMIDALIQREGGFVLDDADSGGPTNYGITLFIARKYGYTGEMRLMPKSVAEDIYTKMFWTEPMFDKVYEQFGQLGEKMFDMGVNCGLDLPARSLQRCLNGLNNQGADYPEVSVDGKLGPATLYALQQFLTKRAGNGGRRTLLFMVAAQQSNYYLDVAEKNPKNEKFLYGWESQRALYDAIL